MTVSAVMKPRSASRQWAKATGKISAPPALAGGTRVGQVKRGGRRLNSPGGVAGVGVAGVGVAAGGVDVDVAAMTTIVPVIIWPWTTQSYW